jgi:hypothetical protein
MFSSQHFGFPLSVLFHQCSTLTFIYMLLLSEGQTGAAWELQKATLFRKSENVRWKKIFRFFPSAIGCFVLFSIPLLVGLIATCM